MSHGLMVFGVLVFVITRLGASPAPAQASVSQPDPATAYIHNNLPELWEVLAKHDALESTHQMARKSVRSPSRRLRFGRRSDPLMAPSFPIQDFSVLGPYDDELMPSRAARAPVRMRFGRRSLEMAVPQTKLDEDSISNKDIRTPSMRLRFGRRSDLFMLPYEQAEREYRTNQDIMDADAEE